MAEREKSGVLKAGLEIHQQLDTGKLFCRCPSRLVEGEADYTIRRRIRLTASELGEFDPAAVEMAAKNYSFVYKGYREVCCLVENDEEPPHSCNREALETALEISLLTGAAVTGRLYTMRKIVIDGSNVSGFQRTMLVSRGGKITLKDGREVGMQTLALEEDAARPLSRDDEKREITYSLDRLGIPLIEMATEPCLTSPEEVKEAALAIGELLRITCRAKRGLGTIRQDLNISIGGGARVEIKGVQELQRIDDYVRREMQRQKALIDIRNLIKEKKISKGSFNLQPLDVSSTFSKSGCSFIMKGVQAGMKVYAAGLSGFRGILGKVIQPNRRFGTELASCVKAKTGLKGLLHSDELPAYGISAEEVKDVAEKAGCTENDAFVMVMGSGEKCMKALEAVKERCLIAFERVPEETRNALEDGNTEYSRPLPGAARMYPETDIPAISVSGTYLKKLEAGLPKSPEERVKFYTTKFGLSKELAEKMKLSNYARFFEEAAGKGHDATTLAVLLLEGITGMRREGVDVSKADKAFIVEVMEIYGKGGVNRDILFDFVGECLKTGRKPAEVVKKFRAEVAGTKEIEKKVSELISRNREMIKSRGSFAFGALMGDLMKEYKGRVSGKVLGEILRRKLKEEGL
jgi:glutamyl-tRNA(Gln) amidotransferase subunit E